MPPSTPFETVGHAVQAAMEADAPLNERLSIIARAVDQLRPRSAVNISRLVERLNVARAGSTAPNVGDRMPSFILPDESGRLLSLTSLLKNGPVIITFQRGHWCPYCRVSTISLVEIQDDVEKAGAQLVAILPERRRFTSLLKNQTGARFPFLTDMDNGYALSMDLAVWVGADMMETMAEGGVDLPKYQDNQSWFLPIPATFVVAADGTVAARYVDPDWRRRMEIQDLLAALKRVR